MSLYGALFGGVSGLRSQSSKIGVISDNIANVNTIGYKQARATFQTLVVNTNTAASYSTGGVRAGTELNVTKQGLLQATESATDIAISGAGFFVVRSVAEPEAGDTSATPYYTRAGSFSQDALGNFVNTQGFYLQGWPLDGEGRLPGEVGNLNTIAFTNFDSLETVNVETASGVAQATTNIEIGANLKSSQTVYPGQAITLQPDSNTPNNANRSADSIIVGSEYGLATANDVRRGDRFTVSTGNGLQYDYEYGGFTIGRQVTTSNGAVNYGDDGSNNTALYALDSGPNVEINSAGGIDIIIPNHGLIDGDTITLSNFSVPIGATPIGQLNATHTVQRIDANTIRITPSMPHGIAGPYPVSPPAGDNFNADTRQYSGNILDATSATSTFLSTTGVTGFSATALTFTIATPSVGTRTFRYTTTAPNTLGGEFNNLTSLATAINSVTGLSARVVDGRLVVGSEDASEAVTFQNGDVVGSATQRGIDWVTELGLQDVAAGSRRFSSLQGLADIVEADEGVSATISNPLASASLSIRVDDPLDTITMTDLGQLPSEITTAGTPIAVTAGVYTAGSNVTIDITDAALAATLQTEDRVYISGLLDSLAGFPGVQPNGGPYRVSTIVGNVVSIEIPVTQDVTIGGGPYAAPSGNRVSIAGESNQGSLLAQLGVVASLNGNDYLTGTGAGPQTSGVQGPQYDPTGTVGGNMASGDITAQFSRNVRIYDSLGSGHDIRFSFIKTATNTWAVEVHVIPESDISSTLVDGQIATGQIIFNGDGSLRSVSASLSNAIPINWTNGAEPSSVTLDLGTAGEPFGTVGAAIIGLTDGLSQFDSAYNVAFANQNGAPVGQLVSVAIDADGFVIASYSNGQTQALFKLPLADFANPNGLNPVTGNVYTQTQASGEVNLREAGTNGTGKFVSAALEQSNVDLAEQLTDMIVAQRSYQANTRVIKTTDELLEQLNQI